MKFDLGAILSKLPEIIRVGTIIANKMKTPGADKKSRRLCEHSGRARHVRTVRRRPL